MLRACYQCRRANRRGEAKRVLTIKHCPVLKKDIYFDYKRSPPVSGKYEGVLRIRIIVTHPPVWVGKGWVQVICNTADLVYLLRTAG